MNSETQSTKRQSLTSKLNDFRLLHPSVDTSNVELYIKTGLLASASKLMAQLSRKKK
jgi:hypothetical protein